MKKFVFTVLIFLFFALPAYAEQEITPKDLFFNTTPGKYIYSNNPEFITRELLSDMSNPNPTYLMSNHNMTQDSYALFVSHINHTKILKDSQTIAEPGFEIEVDVQFKANEDTKILITNLGFEVPENKYYFMNGQRHTYEELWGCLNAWSNYLEMPLFQIESGKKYFPEYTDDLVIEIRKGEEFWLSSVIENYRAVPFFRPVHIIADFEIQRGDCDINVAALRSNGSVGDRSNHNPNASFSRYIKDRQYKGIADSLNKVTCELNYTIDHTVYNKTKLPVMVHNQHAPDEGNYTQTWVSHINPKANIPTQYHVVETDMLKFRYKDDNKLRYYGSNVADEEKDNVWYFDTFHSDCDEYPGRTSGFLKRNYKPNYEIPSKTVDYTTCNLGNYGVKEQYILNIKNDGWSTRYLNYNLYSESNVIVILRDKDGNPLLPYALCKGATVSKEEDVILSIPLPAQVTTSFIIEVILPTNYNGAVMNSIEVVNTETNVMIYEPSITEYSKDYGFTGQEFTKWINRELYTSIDLENWSKQPLTAETKRIFEGCWGEFEFLKIPDGYMAKPTLYDGTPYYMAQDFYKKVYFLDNSFNLVSEYEFGYYPTAMSYANGVYYIYAGSGYMSSDKKQWFLCPDNNPFPTDNGSEFVTKTTPNGIMIYNDGYIPVLYEDIKPPYIDRLGDIYFFVDDNVFYSSHNGIYWETTLFSERISSVYKIGNYVTINKSETEPVNLPDAPVIILDDVFLGFSQLPEIDNNGTAYVPLRFLAESTGAEVIWNQSEGSVEIVMADNRYVISSDTGYIKEGAFMVPIRTVCEKLGFVVSWDNGIIKVSKENNL